MKALICLLILCFLSFTNFSPLTARAAEAEVLYAYAATRTVYFCGERDLASALFTIPYTYCGIVLDEEPGWCHVKYAEDVGNYCALFGYCKKDGLIISPVPPENVWLNRQVTVVYQPNSGEDNLPTLGEINVTAAYYGDYVAGAKTYSYVHYDGRFGYIAGAAAEYPLNSLPEIRPEEPEQKEGNSAIIAAVAITVIAVLAIAVLYLAGRKPALTDK